MPVSDVEIKALAAIVVLLLFGYLWLRRIQHKSKLERKRKLRCKELILDNRLKLANAGVDFDRLVELVRQKILPDQLETVIGILTAEPVVHNIDNQEDADSMKVDLDFEGEPVSSRETAPVSEEGEEKQPEVFEKMGPEKEKKWMRVARNRFRRALGEKEIIERQAKLRLLVKMVELGKKAVEEDSEKSVERKEYELSLWDRFYEDEYLDLQSE
jgi:hypothetical protein